MKKFLSFVVLASFLFVGNAFGMKRKNDGDFEESDKKRRKIDVAPGRRVCPKCKRVFSRVSAMRRHRETFRDSDCRQESERKVEYETGLPEKARVWTALYRRLGFFCCPDCLYQGDVQGAFYSHCVSECHAGHLLKGKYLAYQRGDGRFYCDFKDCDCNYGRGGELGVHLRNKHRFDTSKLKKRRGKKWYDEFERDGKFFCPDCGEGYSDHHELYYHLVTNEHAGYKAYAGVCDKYEDGLSYVCPGCKERFDSAYELCSHCEKYSNRGSKSLGAVWCNEVKVIDGDDILDARRNLSGECCRVEFKSCECFQHRDKKSSGFHALFNGVAFVFSNPEIMKRGDWFRSVWEKSSPVFGENGFDANQLFKLIKSVDLFKKLHDGGRQVDDVSIIEDLDEMRCFSAHTKHNILRFTEDKTRSQVVFLRLSDGCWIAAKLSFDVDEEEYCIEFANSGAQDDGEYCKKFQEQVVALFSLFAPKAKFLELSFS